MLWVGGFKTDTVKENFLKCMKALGIEHERIFFANRTSTFEHHLSRLQLADVFLDTSPYNGHTSSADALFAGLPLITLEGKSFQARVAGSMLNTLGLKRWIAKNTRAYVDIASRLGQSQALLAEAKHDLVLAKQSSSLFDSDKFVNDFEDTILKAYREKNGFCPVL